MATRTLKTSGGPFNWNSAGSWNEGAFPVAGDAVTCSGSSEQLTVNVTSACDSIDFTGYTGTLVMTSSLTVTAGVTLASGMSITQTASLTLNGTQTLTSNGKVWSAALTLNGAFTYTLADDWTVNSSLSYGNSGNALVVNGNTLNVGGNFTAGSSSTMGGTTTLRWIAASTFTGSSGILSNPIVFDASANTVTMNSAVTLGGGGSMTYTSGTLSIGTSSVVTVNGTYTFNFPATGGNPGLYKLTMATVTSTITLSADLLVRNNFTLSNAALTFAGAFNLTCATLIFGTISSSPKTLTLVSGQTYTVTTALTATGTTSGNGRALMVASSAGTKAKFVLQNGATQDVSWVEPTDIDSSIGQQIFSFRSTITTSYNWYSTFPVVRRYPTGQLGVG